MRTTSTVEETAAVSKPPRPASSYGITYCAYMHFIAYIIYFFFFLAESGSHQNEVYFHVRRQNRPESWDVSSWPLRDHDVQHSRTVRYNALCTHDTFLFSAFSFRIQAFH